MQLNALIEKRFAFFSRLTFWSYAQNKAALGIRAFSLEFHGGLGHLPKPRSYDLRFSVEPRSDTQELPRFYTAREKLLRKSG
jgi:hypothetical protein